MARCQPKIEHGASAVSGRSCYRECSRRCLASCVVQRTRDARDRALLPDAEALPEFPDAMLSEGGSAEAVVEAAAAEEPKEAAAPSASAVAALERHAVDELSQMLADLSKKR